VIPGILVHTPGGGFNFVPPLPGEMIQVDEHIFICLMIYELFMDKWLMLTHL